MKASISLCHSAAGAVTALSSELKLHFFLSFLLLRNAPRPKNPFLPFLLNLAIQVVSIVPYFLIHLWPTFQSAFNGAHNIVFTGLKYWTILKNTKSELMPITRNFTYKGLTELTFDVTLDRKNPFDVIYVIVKSSFLGSKTRLPDFRCLAKGFMHGFWALSIDPKKKWEKASASNC